MTSIDEAWQMTFRNLERRCSEVEFVPISHSSDDRMAPTFRAKLFQFDEEGFIVEEPNDPEAGRYLTVGARVNVLGWEDNHRWECLTAVSEKVEYRLTGRSKHMAIRLAWPHEVRSAQRRQHPRMSLKAVKLQPVVLFPIAPTPIVQAEAGEPAPTTSNTRPGAFGLPRDPFEARLLNIGAGGIGVDVTDREGASPAKYSRYRVVVSLPSQQAPLVLESRVAHRQPRLGGRHYLGMAFQFESPDQEQTTAESVDLFLAWMDRQAADEGPGPIRNDDDE